MNDVRSIRLRIYDVPVVHPRWNLHALSRSRLHGGNMRGPSTQDCEKSFARTGIPSANMLAKKDAGASLRNANLVQIRALPVSVGTATAGAIA